MNALFFVGPKGAEVSFVSADGEILRTLVVPPGIHAAATYRKLRGPGETVAFSTPLYALSAKSASIRHPGHLDSAANPSFRVSPAQRQAKELRGLLARSEALNRSAQKAMQAVKRAKRDLPQIEDRRGDAGAKPDAGQVPAS